MEKWDVSETPIHIRRMAGNGTFDSWPTSKTVQEDYAILTNASEPEVDESQAPSVVYKRPGAPTLTAYNRCIIDPSQTNSSDPDMKELEPEQIEEFQCYFLSSFIKEPTEAGLEVGTQSEANTMRRSFTASGLKAWPGEVA